MHIDLTGKVALITGAAQGIGLGTAKQLAASGAKVLLTDIQDETGQEAAKSIEGASFLYADVSREDDIKRMIETVVERYGRLDILVNNAWAGKKASALETTSAEWDEGYAVLVKAVFLASKYAIPHFKNAGGGSIINIASVLAHQPKLRDMIYVSAKGAVLHLTRQLALEYASDNIRVNSVTPGHIQVRPPKSDNLKDEAIQPLPRVGMPSDIANTICFLVSEQAGFITGAEIVVDGGLLLPFADYWLQMGQLS
jgi:NAD(P)-dependent dehydrogenase (short-subunit alcohol dehydrogenase family)